MMKNSVQQASLLVGQVDSRKVRLFWLLLSVTLFVLGAGAPGSDGGHGF